MTNERDTLRPEPHCDGNICIVDLVYPRHTGIDTVEVGLCDVRAAGAIRVSYDFERDGWVIEQDRNAHVPDFTNPPEEAEEDWVEVYFADAWDAKPAPKENPSTPARPDPLPLLKQAYQAMNAHARDMLRVHGCHESAGQLRDAADAIAAAYPEVTK